MCNQKVAFRMNSGGWYMQMQNINAYVGAH